MSDLLDTGHHDRLLRRRMRNPWFAFWFYLAKWRIRRASAEEDS
jgi:hypothetical protein